MTEDVEAPEKSLAATKDLASEAGFPLRKVSSDPYGGDKGGSSHSLAKVLLLRAGQLCRTWGLKLIRGRNRGFARRSGVSTMLRGLSICIAQIIRSLEDTVTHFALANFFANRAFCPSPAAVGLCV